MLRAEQSEAKAVEVAGWRGSHLYAPRERAALGYAESMTTSGDDVDDEQFEQVRSLFSEDEVVELTAWIALENLYSTFNRALRIEAQGFCRLDLPTD